PPSLRSFPTRRPSDLCVVACADAWRGDGEILASPIGIIPTLAARLARATLEPDLLLTDGEAYLVANDLPVGPGNHPKVVEGWMGSEEHTAELQSPGNL